MMGKKAWLLAILVIFGLTVCATIQSDAEGPLLPNDVNIIPPSPDLLKDKAALSGKWAGTWPAGTECILVVEEIHDSLAQVLYSWAKSPNQPPNGHTRMKCKVVTDPRAKIILEFPRRPNITFELLDSNTVEGNTVWGNPSTGSPSGVRVTMKRVN
jgi:hypothetical protein